MKQIAAAVVAVLFLFPVTLSGADFDGDSRDDVAIFRPSSGLWAIRGVTRVYFGGLADEPRAGDYTGDGIADIAIFRDSAGLWAIRGVTRVYHGRSGDTSIQGGGGQRLYNYVVKRSDGTDLAAALEGAPRNKSVYIPAGIYNVQTDIHVDWTILITGAGQHNTRIWLADNCNIFLEANRGLTMEKLSVHYGGGGSGQIQVDADFIKIIDVGAYNSDSHGFYAMTGADYVSLINCTARFAAGEGFYAFDDNCSFTNCIAKACDGAGFHTCDNLANCMADRCFLSGTGFYQCEQLTNCRAFDCTNGFNNCVRVSSCESLDNTSYGFLNCDYVAASYATANGTNWSNCTHTAACND